MAINLTDALNAATTKGKLADAKQIYLEGDTQTVQKEIEDINSRHNDLKLKHESLSSTVSEHTNQIESNQSQITANKSAQDEKNISLDANMAKLNTRDDQITELVRGITATGGASVATAVTYDNTSSHLASATVQGALDEVVNTKLNKADFNISNFPNKKNGINSVYSALYINSKINTDKISTFTQLNIIDEISTIGIINSDGTINTDTSELNMVSSLYEIKADTNISYNIIGWKQGSLLIALYDENFNVLNSVVNENPGTRYKGDISSGNAKYIAISLSTSAASDITSCYCRAFIKPPVGEILRNFLSSESIPNANVIEGNLDNTYKADSNLYNILKNYLRREPTVGDRIKYQRYKDIYEIAEIKDEFSVALDGYPYNYDDYKLGAISYNDKVSEFKKELYATSTVAGGGSYRHNTYEAAPGYTTHFIPIENALESDSINFRGTTTTQYGNIIAWGFSKDATLTADNYITKFDEASYQNQYSTRYWNIVIPVNEIPRDAKFIFYTRRDKTQDDIALFIKPNYKRTYDIVGEGTVYRHLVNMKFVPISEGSDFLYLGKKFLQVIPGSKFRYRLPPYTYIEIFDSSKKSIRKYGDKTANDPKIYEDTFAENECFITYGSYKYSKDQAFLEIEATPTTVVENEIENYQKEKQGIGGMYENFSVKVNYNEEDLINNSPTELQDTPNYYDDWGVIALPENYSAFGKPTRLIIFCQGTGERVNSETNPIPNFGWKYLLAKGYAVMDMNGMSSEWGTKKGFTVVNQHYGNKYVLQSYKKGYDYVMNKYNLYKEVYVFGISMGGLSSFMITQSGILPVIAQCNFCPVISVYKQAYMHPWGGDNQKKTIAGQWNFDNWKDNSNFDQVYFLSNIDKIKGYDNLLTNVIGSTIGTANENYGNDEEKNAYEALSKIFPVPLKIWHSEDDNTVLIRYSEFMVKMINNAGGKAWLRKMSTGDHVGGWNNGSITDNEVVSGESIDTSIPFYEAVKFIQRYE